MHALAMLLILFDEQTNQIIKRANLMQLDWVQNRLESLNPVLHRQQRGTNEQL